MEKFKPAKVYRHRYQIDVDFVVVNVYRALPRDRVTLEGVWVNRKSGRVHAQDIIDVRLADFKYWSEIEK